MDNGLEKWDLTVRGDTIERLFAGYRSKQFIVNRRYQRKLVWTLEENQFFIDSVSRKYPVPIILLAEKKTKNGSILEIIDGLQRLNAVFGFIENRFSISEGYFDLQSTAFTKELLDSGKLKQLTPVISRSKSVDIASYDLPLSIFEAESDAQIEEVFRRINSGGRKLSRQDLRTAGATGNFADVVRQIAINVRGDTSLEYRLTLNDMSIISITSRGLNYGIPVEDIFWVKNGVVNRDQIRESRDEELIADIV